MGATSREAEKAERELFRGALVDRGDRVGAGALHAAVDGGLGLLLQERLRVSVAGGAEGPGGGVAPGGPAVHRVVALLLAGSDRDQLLPARYHDRGGAR